MNDITQPLRLSRGSHRAGSGKGCAMNIISWENGDTKITDFPECSNQMLSQLVQGVNDSLADSDGYLSAENSLVALDLGHATVGTAYHGLSDIELRVVYVRLAILAARKVSHLNTDPRVEAAILAAEAWASDPSDDNATAAANVAAAAYAATAAAAADAATAATAAAADAAADAAATTAAAAAANAAAYAHAAANANAAAYAAYAAADPSDDNTNAAANVADAAAYAYAAANDAAYADAAADAADRVQFKIDLAWELINEFKRLAGVVEPQGFDEATLSCAVGKMLQVN